MPQFQRIQNILAVCGVDFDSDELTLPVTYKIRCASVDICDYSTIRRHSPTPTSPFYTVPRLRHRSAQMGANRPMNDRQSRLLQHSLLLNPSYTSPRRSVSNNLILVNCSLIYLHIYIVHKEC